MNGILAVLFLIASCGILVFCLYLVTSNNLGENTALFIGGVGNAFLNILLLIVQYYFRKKPTESDGK